MALFFETEKWKNKATGEIVIMVKSDITSSLSGCSMCMHRPLNSRKDNWQMSYCEMFKEEYEPVLDNE